MPIVLVGAILGLLILMPAPRWCRECKMLAACRGGCPEHRFAQTYYMEDHSLILAVVLAIVPYVLIRGTITRLARGFNRKKAGPGPR